MLRLTSSPKALLLSLAVVAALPASVEGQSRTYGVSVDGSAILTSTSLDAGDVFLYGGRLTVAPHPWAKVGIGLQYAASGEAGDYRRPFSMLAPSIQFEGTIKGRDNRIYALLAPSVLIFNLDSIAGGAVAAERLYVPALSAGIGASVRLFGPLALDVTASDMLTWSRRDALAGILQGERVLGHSPRIEAKLSFNFRKTDRIARFEDLPVSFSNEFQPTRARAGLHQEPVLRETAGREHIHVADGVERETEGSNEVRAIESDLLIGTIYFPSGSNAVTREYQSIVRDVAEYLKANPRAKIEIRGFTSPVGNPRYQQTLAQQRANAIRDQLVTYYQVNEHRIVAVTGGADPENSEGIARRVEIRTLVATR